MKAIELLVRLTGRVPMLPDPDPDAPAGLKASASTVISLLKWGSLIAGLAALAGFGMLTLAAEKGGYGGAAATMKEKFGGVIIALIVALNATAIVTFLM